MARKYPPEFKRDLVTVARRGDLNVAQVAIDCGAGCARPMSMTRSRTAGGCVGKLTPVALFGLSFTKAPIRQPPDLHNEYQLNRQRFPEGVHV